MINAERDKHSNLFPNVEALPTPSSSNHLRLHHIDVFPEKAPQDSHSKDEKNHEKKSNSKRAPTNEGSTGEPALLTWSSAKVAQWLYNDIGVRPDVVERLKDVDGARLLTLTDTDLFAMGVHQGFVRQSILVAVGQMNENGVAASGTGAGSGTDVPPPYIG
ncbi:hypothetical protein HDU97_003999 [Phlyctochytrium planicorne]|nr:hypothetical protein HDU97_003999 [Phlyctochytrium planicorne]